MIKPTVGDDMWYRPKKFDTGTDPGDQPLAAIVTKVHDDNLVNLNVFGIDGVSHSRLKVPIVQEGGPHTPGALPHCEWRPDRVGQAKKHEGDEPRKQPSPGSMSPPYGSFAGQSARGEGPREEETSATSPRERQVIRPRRDTQFEESRGARHGFDDGTD
jgi:hypothetical protein